jgi:predicted enzyme related to lactoylglutathione lyase
VDFGGIVTKSSDIAMPFWLYYVNVADIEATGARITANGGQVLNGPMEVPGSMWIIQGKDPQGAMFAVVGPKV